VVEPFEVFQIALSPGNALDIFLAEDIGRSSLSSQKAHLSDKLSSGNRSYLSFVPHDVSMPLKDEQEHKGDVYDIGRHRLLLQKTPSLVKVLDERVMELDTSAGRI